MIDVGDAVELSAQPVDPSGNSRDIDDIQAKLTLPDGTILTFAPDPGGPGDYRLTYTTTQAGRHLVQWVGTGYALTDVFNVWPSDPRFLFSLADARRQLKILADDGWDDEPTDDDELMRLYIAAVTPVIEDITGPLVGSNLTKTADGGTSAILLDGPSTVTAVTANGMPVEFTANAAAGIVYAGTPSAPGRFLCGRQNIVITYSVTGVIPPNVMLAALEEFRFLWQIGQQGSRPSFGGDDEQAEAWTPSGYAVPRRVIELCAGSQRLPGMA